VSRQEDTANETVFSSALFQWTKTNNGDQRKKGGAGDMVATRKCRARRNDGSRLYVARGVVAVGTLLSVCARLPPGQPLGLGPWPAQDAVPGLVSSPSTCFVDSAFVAMRTRACSLPPFQMISAAATRTR
jgi:hypothetical protein